MALLRTLGSIELGRLLLPMVTVLLLSVTVVPGLGAIETGALEPGALELGALEPGALEPGALDSGALEPGALEPGALVSDVFPFPHAVAASNITRTKRIVSAFFT